MRNGVEIGARSIRVSKLEEGDYRDARVVKTKSYSSKLVPSELALKFSLTSSLESFVACCLCIF